MAKNLFGGLWSSQNDKRQVSSLNEMAPPELVHWVTLKSRRLRPGTCNTFSRYTSCGVLSLRSIIRTWTVPETVALTMFPFATSTMDSDGSESLTMSSR